MTQELSPNKQPIAVVGVSALFPGSTDATGFWRDILAGRDLIRDVPESHWLVEDFYDADPSAPDKTYARRGAFLDPIDFDALGWGVPPSTIPATDTSQLLALVLAQRVLQDAARGQFETMDRSRISVILGVTSAQELLSSMVSRLQRPVWVKALRESGLPETEVQAACDRISASYVPWQESTFPGLLGNVVAGRIANRLNLGGTNCVTDAACASTFSALAMGVSELQLGNSDLVISGGVDTLNDIFMFMCFSKTPALSPTGDCRPFSDQADGTMLGEGLGMVALKRLADAERDGDRIYAVVRGVGTSSDGRSKSVYAPVPAGQAQALRRTYALAGYGPETVELLEAHGTGTKAGDAAEFEGLRMVFDEASDTRQWCALGSVKSQIGHTKAAAGAAGLFKAVMALHHKVLPPSIKIDAPNPKLRLEESPFYLSTKTRPWIRDGQHPRRASVSAFGFGGSNFHVALEEYQGPAPKAERLYTGSRELVAICGENGAEVARRARELVNGGSSLGVAARASQKAYVAGAAARLAVVASDRTELDAKLLAAAKRIESKPGEPFTLPDGTAYGAGPESGKLAFLFPGQGSQYVGMGAELAIHFGAGRGPWDRAADLSLEPGTPLHEVVFPRPGFGAAKERADEDRLTATEWAQPAIGCVSLSQLALLHGIGIRPEMVAGHSFGEVVALHAAGVVDECDLLRVARRRGELMAEAASIPGGMTSLSLPVERVRELVARLEPRVVVANHNGPAQVVVSGPADALAAFEAKLLREGIAAKRLPVATAFHSSVVASSCAPFADFLSGISFEPARLPVYSNALAAPYENDAEVLRAGLASQIASPVRFVEMVEAMYAAGARTFVEVGPGSVLTSLVDAILGEKPHLAVNLDRKGKDGVESLLLALARLVAAGAPMKLDRLFAEYRESVDVSAAGKLAVPISGSNYGKIYPPPGGAKALPLPNPPRPVAPAAPPKEAVKPAERPVAAPAPVESPVIASPVPAVPAPPPASSVWVNAFQESQRQTADAHAAFQRAMFESHTAFLSVAESAFQGLTALVSGAPFAASRETERTAVAPPVQAVVVSPVVAAPPARPVAETLRPAPEAQPPAPALAPVFQPVAPVLVPVASASPAVDLRSSSFQGSASPAAPARSLGSSTDLQALMLTVVAEKTGYPTDMLNLDMDLEGDLGIDSIKRVEILAAVDERAPELPNVDMSHMGGLQTLRQIVDYMQGLATSTVAPAQPSTVPAPFSAPAPAGSSIPTGTLPVAAASTVDLKALMLAVVAEKTGYPMDMLNLDMDLEGDLGIDSIKRVEILAAVDERAPELPKVDMSHMGGLQTLRQIVDYMQSLATPTVAPARPPTVPATFSAPAPAPAGSSIPTGALPVAAASTVDLKALMLAVVAEKTGYPTDMLNLDMDLEGDLGIDSIKRVEILAAVDERAPELPKVDMSHMGGLQTLRQIVDYMQGLATSTVAPAQPSTVPAPFSAPAPAGSSIPTGTLPVAAASTVDLKALMLAVVAEKTGYPMDMLNLDMDLEGDLGIDSIKRVEILAAVDERAPELPKVDMSHMGGLQTLRQIVDYMQSLATPTVAPARPPTVPATFSAPAPAPAGSSIPTGALPVAAASTVDLKALMLAVVAEKTGYPTDMLNLDMDLEGDLGIDSIKRVEILAAVDERAPELPKVDMSHMGGLQTLRQIVDYMQGLATPTFAPAQPPTVPAPFSAPAPAPAGSSIPTGALPVAAASTVDLKALMLTVVAEKTGYPMDMLNLDMDLEGDLGIDSIKRVEILAAVDERAPELPNVDMSHMGGLQTLRQIVQYMQDLATPTVTSVPLPAVPTTVTVSAPVPAPVTVRAHVPAHAPAQLFVNAHLPTPVASHPSPLGRFRLELIAAPTTGLAQPGLLGGGEVWITGGGELDAALAAELSRRGVNARAAGAVPAGATACVYLGGLRAVASDDEALSVNREAFDVARILARRLETSRGLFVTVQDTGGAFGLAEMEARRAWLSGLPALVKTAAQEWPQASLKAIDLERAGRDAPSIAVAVADELLRGGGEIEVALPASGGRFTLRSVPGPVEPGEAVIGRGEVVVVSGGARGVTAACVAEWARDCHARFVLLGRTPLQDDPASCLGVVDESGLKAALLAEARSAGQSPKPSELLARVRGVQGNREIRQTLAAVEAAGGRARYEAVSVTDVQALAFTLARVRAEWGPVVGVVHAAGVLADKKISEKTDEAFDRVFDTKVEGLRALLSATAADPLKLLCVFSSVSARCGNNGQSDYAMANEILAKVALAESRRRPGVLVKSLGWGPWEGGMVTPQLRGRFAALGVPMIPLAVGARMMADELTGANCQDVELVLGGEPKAEALLFAGAEARVQELELRVQRGSHGYLEGHAVNGMPVVPVVLAAEWLSRAARCFRPGLSLAALHDFKVLKGIRLGGFDNGGDRFVIQATQLPSARGAQLQLVVRDSHGALHYSARAELLPEPRTPDAGLPALSLEAWAGEPLYKDLLFHRGKFELIEQMDGISDHGVGATLRGVHHAGWNGGEPWQLDVAALDGGLQMAVLFGQRMLGGPNLPTSIDEVRSYGVSPGKGLITAAAYGRKVGSAAVTTDILFTDDQGRRLAALLGVQNHVLPRA